MIYFDSAATSFQKPPTVKTAVENALETMTTPGRGGYTAAIRAAETAFLCRCELAEMFGADNPEQVVFTFNATHALNIAIKTLVPFAGKVVISGYEHNAVTRPLALRKAQICVATAPLFSQEEVVEAFDNAIREDTDAVICSHVSNVFGFIHPIKEIAAICRRKGVPLIVDASQSAGVIPISMTELDAAFIAMPGHKGLCGMQGTGVLLCGKSQQVETILEGGTGSLSLQQEMPDFLPDRLEAGTHNMPGIAGLLAGIRFVRENGVQGICEHERKLALLAAEGLREFSGMQVFSEEGLKNQTGVLSFRQLNADVEETAEILAKQGIAVRAGLHCAPLAHRSAGTLETGTVRLSFSPFNTHEEVYGMLAVFEACKH